MANISAADVAKLRRLTGAGMLDCKRLSKKLMATLKKHRN